MAKTNLKTSLKKAWQETVKKELLVSTIKTKNNGTFKFGVKNEKNKLKYFAHNITLDKPIKAQVKEKKIAGTKFIIQLNEFRALRPGGHQPKIGRQPTISKAANRCRFYCKSPKNPLSLSSRPILHKVTEKSYKWNYYYNAFPFMPEGHFMILPTNKKTKDKKLPHLPQILNEKIVKDLISIFKKSTGIINIYQSMRAGATVNHLHLQCFFHTKRFAVEDAKVILNKLIDYPADAFVYNLNKNTDVIWPAINILQKNKIPFDIVNLKNKLYIFPRHPEHEVVSEFPDGGVGANELMGIFVTTSPTVYKKMTKTKLLKAIKKTTLEI